MVVGIVLLVGLIVAGGIGTTKIISENRHVGDANTKVVYDLKFCEIKDTSVKLVSFSTIGDAYKAGYKDAACNR